VPSVIPDVVVDLLDNLLFGAVGIIYLITFMALIDLTPLINIRLKILMAPRFVTLVIKLVTSLSS
jgi:hypothetical protein